MGKQAAKTQEWLYNHLSYYNMHIMYCCHRHATPLRDNTKIIRNRNFFKKCLEIILQTEDNNIRR